MGPSWRRTAADFKSPMRVVIRFLTRSRDAQDEKRRELQEKQEQWKQMVARQQVELEAARREAAAVGFRGSERVMKIMFEALKRPHNIPHGTSIRGWLLRSGVLRPGALALALETGARGQSRKLPFRATIDFAVSVFSEPGV